jgi:hypothetical protein
VQNSLLGHASRAASQRVGAGSQNSTAASCWRAAAWLSWRETAAEQQYMTCMFFRHGAVLPESDVWSAPSSHQAHAALCHGCLSRGASLPHAQALAGCWGGCRWACGALARCSKTA